MRVSPTPNPSRKREGDEHAEQQHPPRPSRLREGQRGLRIYSLAAAGWANCATNPLPKPNHKTKPTPMPTWKPRNTARARELRNAATPAERRLWEYLARGQLGAKFSRQMPVGPWYADFLCRSLSLVVELDGFSHDVAPDKDVRRDADLTARGYTVLHFLNEDVMEDAEAVARAIQHKIEELQAEKPTTPSRPREG